MSSQITYWLYNIEFCLIHKSHSHRFTHIQQLLYKHDHKEIVLSCFGIVT